MTAFVTVEGRTLAAALKSINMIIERRNTIPILSCVRVRIEKGDPKLIITGTDLDMRMTVLVDVLDLGDADFDFCLPSLILEQIAAKAGPAPVKITPSPADPKHKDKFNPDLALIDVAEGDAHYSLQSLPAIDWPSMKDMEWTPLETFTNGRMATILDKVSSCISSEETRYYLNGVCWLVDTFGRSFTATDGHRLASCKYAETDTAGAVSSTIIPRSAVKVLSNIAKGKDVAVYGAGENKHLRFAIDGGPVLITKTIDGTFPDFRRVIPKDVPHMISFDADLLRQAVERVTMLSSERGRAVRIYQGPDGSAYVGVNNPNSGAADAKAFAPWPTVPANRERVEGRTYAATYSSFGFNAHYLLAALGKKPGTFTLRFADGGSPFLIEDGDDEMTRVLMPMRV